MSETGFSEREFYKNEFRGRTLGIALTGAFDSEPLIAALKELVEGGCRAVVLAPEGEAWPGMIEDRIVPAAQAALEGRVWRALRAGGSCGVALDPSQPLAEGCKVVVRRLGLFKLVWIDPEGGLVDDRGKRLAFVDRAQLRGWLMGDPPDYLTKRIEVCRLVDTMLEAGVPAVNLCALADLADDLFTYAGTGTLFTGERYVTVRPLGVDDFDAAYDLLRRGVEEGYLLPRTSSAVDRVLANAFGAFVEGRYLAGIGTLLLYESTAVGEIASLYTLTRFLGEGVGEHLVTHALNSARERGLAEVFACTGSARVAAFFERQGFERVASERLPAERWQGYPAARRAELVCLRHGVS